MTDEATHFRPNYIWTLVLTDVLGNDEENDKRNFILDLWSRLSSYTESITMYLAFPNGNYDDARFFYDLIQNARFVNKFHIRSPCIGAEFSFSKLNSTFFTSNTSKEACDSTKHTGPVDVDVSYSFRTQFLEVIIMSAANSERYIKIYDRHFRRISLAM